MSVEWSLALNRAFTKEAKRRSRPSPVNVTPLFSLVWLVLSAGVFWVVSRLSFKLISVIESFEAAWCDPTSVSPSSLLTRCCLVSILFLAIGWTAVVVFSAAAFVTANAEVLRVAASLVVSLFTVVVSLTICTLLWSSFLSFGGSIALFFTDLLLSVIDFWIFSVCKPHLLVWLSFECAELPDLDDLSSSSEIY